MTKDGRKYDQADQLREQMETLEPENQIQKSLPPRSQIHRRTRKKKKVIPFSFPLIRVLLLLFFVIIIAALTSPYWL
ncbi:hypothetical protein N0O92_07375 [Alkalihalobacillus sp. MEB130]|uniref:hypothetical protein n=1 Tax=Alkalihalobacillus sp. MEB130 TaxID=2976704 RepID=UPI0028E07D30|nr:hypothetical protein [Alkalihalobacillus sp. MEB130]MDT8860051.1 hypothetical protein [Alkalihalobacillus sp. MEB130]